ncbi:TetR/AcrR family transcriptional regulator [Chengkuizengella sediminis]|uniref:TetR/AcrR family transcriptional regulator n=1 Tax=Chengkuizengella sediminis TaxID=1885917 RepID=UPI001389D90C|nr:TetR/AcrR family transcriptional regulator [Chengkuizengella sediminis]NDI35990.1 TetR/AcrR family transcriptional regulator [Chengkuizengella sediminis]
MKKISEKSKKKKEHILQSTIELIVEIGLEKISINKVVNKANVSKGGFYYYFSNIDDLIKETFIFSINNSLEGIKIEQGVSLEKNLKQFNRDLIQSIKHKSENLSMMFLFISKCFQDPKYKQEFVKMKKRIMEENIVSKELTEHYSIDQKLLKIVDMLSIGMIVHGLMDEDEDGLIKLCDDIVDKLLVK